MFIRSIAYCLTKLKLILHSGNRKREKKSNDQINHHILQKKSSFEIKKNKFVFL